MEYGLDNSVMTLDIFPYSLQLIITTDLKLGRLLRCIIPEQTSQLG